MRYDCFLTIFEMIKNVIFDLCGPLITIDVNLIDKRLHELGVRSQTGYHDLHDAGLIKQYDAGLISPEDFASEARKVLGNELTPQVLWDAWNVVVTGFDLTHVGTVRRLKSAGYKTFVLSNSDVVNAEYFCQYMNQHSGMDFTRECFTEVFFSYQLKCRKPDTEIFEKILHKHNLLASETLFIDDSRKNCLGAEKAGLQTHYLANCEQIEDVVEFLINNPV